MLVHCTNSRCILLHNCMRLLNQDLICYYPLLPSVPLTSLPSQMRRREEGCYKRAGSAELLRRRRRTSKRTPLPSLKVQHAAAHDGVPVLVPRAPLGLDAGRDIPALRGRGAGLLAEELAQLVQFRRGWEAGERVLGVSSA